MLFVEVKVSHSACPIEEELDGVILVARTTLVEILFEMKIFNDEIEEHAGRIAKSMIAKALGVHATAIMRLNARLAISQICGILTVFLFLQESFLSTRLF
jgi:uncharacterized protein (UPF0212 family)